LSCSRPPTFPCVVFHRVSINLPHHVLKLLFFVRVFLHFEARCSSVFFVWLFAYPLKSLPPLRDEPLFWLLSLRKSPGFEFAGFGVFFFRLCVFFLSFSFFPRCKHPALAWPCSHSPPRFASCSGGSNCGLHFVLRSFERARFFFFSSFKRPLGARGRPPLSHSFFPRLVSIDFLHGGRRVDFASVSPFFFFVRDTHHLSSSYVSLCLPYRFAPEHTLFFTISFLFGLFPNCPPRCPFTWQPQYLLRVVFLCLFHCRFSCCLSQGTLVFPSLFPFRTFSFRMVFYYLVRLDCVFPPPTRIRYPSPPHMHPLLFVLSKLGSTFRPTYLPPSGAVRLHAHFSG